MGVEKERCSERGCVFLPTPSGRCIQHERIFKGSDQMREQTLRLKKSPLDEPLPAPVPARETVDISEYPQIVSVADIGRQIQQEIQQTKNGSLDLQKAAVIINMRKQQFRVLELLLQAYRIDKAMRPLVMDSFKLLEKGGPPDKAA